MKYSLPDSADDLLIKDGRLLMRSLSVYEVLRRFEHIIRLTPFRFENFCAALLAEEQTALLAEIHIQLLRTLIREDRQQQTWLGPPDLRDSVNIYLHLTDHATWPAALRIYLSADPIGNESILEYLSQGDSNNYPFHASLAVKLDVLEQLCDQFLLSNLAREEIVNGSAIIKHDPICRFCSKPNGDLIPCGNCPAVYHLKCSDPPLENYPDQEDEEKVYLCVVCRSNHVVGVSDCKDLNEESGNLKRLETLGLDKLGRRYWFLARRLFVVDENEEDVRYYTTTEQLKEILGGLHENRYEKDLIDNILNLQEEMERQMKITEDLYVTLMKDHKKEDGTYSRYLGQEGSHRDYTNFYSSSNLALGKNQNSDRDINRSLSNKFCMTSANSFKWHGAIDGHLNILTMTIRSTLLRFESTLPTTFIHPCWQAQKSSWVRSINNAQKPEDFAMALTKLEHGIRPILFKAAWFDSVGFSQLFRSTLAEREELRKTDRQPRGFERREWVSQDFELSYRLGTMVKFSAKLKPVKHQVWKQKGEEYRLTGLNGWYWLGRTHRSRLRSEPRLYRIEPFKWLSPVYSHPFIVDLMKEKIEESDVIDIGAALSSENDERFLYPKKPVVTLHRRKRIDKLEGLLQKRLIALEKEKTKKLEENGVKTPASQGTIDLMNLTNNHISTPVKSQAPPTTQLVKKCVLARPKLPPCHNFLTKRGKVRSVLVLPDLELRRLARSGGLKECKSFLYLSKQNSYVWPYGMTPRPAFRTCWHYRNHLIKTMQDVALQMKVIYASIRWDDLQVRPPASGHNIITTDDSTVTIQLLKKRDRLPYLLHSEYLIKKTVAPIEQPTKYRKIGSKKVTPSARSGLRARRQTEEEEEKVPTTEEIWVAEHQLELWELKQFDEKIEKQNQLMRERALREEAERKRKVEEEKRRKADLERRRRAEEEAKKARLSQTHAINASTPSTPQMPRMNISLNVSQQQGSTPTTPVLRYFRTEQGQIIRLPASYLQRGTPLILRHVGPGPNQTNTYIIRPQLVTTPNVIRNSTPTIRLATPISNQSPAVAINNTSAATAAASDTSTTIPSTTTTTTAATTTISTTTLATNASNSSSCVGTPNSTSSTTTAVDENTSTTTTTSSSTSATIATSSNTNAETAASATNTSAAIASCTSSAGTDTTTTTANDTTSAGITTTATAGNSNSDSNNTSASTADSNTSPANDIDTTNSSKI